MTTLAHDRSGQPWTGDEDRALVWMRVEGWRWEDVAEALGRSPCACSARAPLLKNSGRWRLPAEAFEDDALDIEEELVSEPDAGAPYDEPPGESPITEADLPPADPEPIEEVSTPDTTPHESAPWRALPPGVCWGAALGKQCPRLALRVCRPTATIDPQLKRRLWSIDRAAEQVRQRVHVLQTWASRGWLTVLEDGEGLWVQPSELAEAYERALAQERR